MSIGEMNQVSAVMFATGQLLSIAGASVPIVGINTITVIGTVGQGIGIFSNPVIITALALIAIGFVFMAAGFYVYTKGKEGEVNQLKQNINELTQQLQQAEKNVPRLEVQQAEENVRRLEARLKEHQQNTRIGIQELEAQLRSASPVTS